jgi:hypothetical protein
MAGALDKVFSLLAGDDEGEEGETHALLKQVAKDLSQNRFSKFYKTRSAEMDSSFAAFLYDIYKVMLPFKEFAQDSTNTLRIKELTVETFLPKETLALTQKLKPEAVRQMMKTMKPKEIIESLKSDQGLLSSAFSSSGASQMNHCYNMLCALLKFAQFDFPAFFRRFDPHFPLGNVAYTAHFAAVKGDEIIDGLGILQGLIQPIEPGDDWKTVLSILKIANNGKELASFNSFDLALVNIHDLKQSGVIDLIGQLISQNPVWQAKPARYEEHLAETWLNEKNDQVQRIIDQIVTSQRNAQIRALATAIFGTPDVTRLQFYTKEQNEVYVQKGLNGFA